MQTKNLLLSPGVSRGDVLALANEFADGLKGRAIFREGKNGCDYIYILRHGHEPCVVRIRYSA